MGGPCSTLPEHDLIHPFGGATCAHHLALPAIISLENKTIGVGPADPFWELKTEIKIRLLPLFCVNYC